MTRQEIIKAIGFERTEINLDSLKPTKANLEFIDKLNRSKSYEIYTNETEISVDSAWLVTKAEIKILEKLTGKTFIKMGTKVDMMGYWKTWCESK